ncbi:MAG TPA: hypothetical protein VMZ30_03975, partial [Pyrinomonadaceae bacterium]|nr:hypothetical protein [Pyrinomonadaceae bacterium]
MTALVLGQTINVCGRETHRLSLQLSQANLSIASGVVLIALSLLAGCGSGGGGNGGAASISGEAPSLSGEANSVDPEPVTGAQAQSTKFIPTFVVYYGGGPTLGTADVAKLAKYDLIDTDRFRYN